MVAAAQPHQSRLVLAVHPPGTAVLPPGTAVLPQQLELGSGFWGDAAVFSGC